MQLLKRREKNKRFHDKRCKKLCKNRNRKKKRTHNANYRPNKSKRILLSAPPDLRIFDQTTEDVEFFNYIIDVIKHCAVKSVLYFDLSKVEVITPDAVMYLIAIIKNTKRLRMLEIRCEGNMPINEDARLVFQQAGFFKFVYAHFRDKIKEDTKYMKIENGKNADSITASSFCDFVQSTFQKTHMHTKRLFPMIVELMTNTYQHAYRNDNGLDGLTEMNTNWYIFAQDVGNAIRFIFLDTGVGIPRTVARRNRERIANWFNLDNDVIYLESVLKGDYSRSETGLLHRGKGLPEIYNDCKNGYISNLRIISGKAKCIVNADSTISANRTDAVFKGTLFSWEIIK